MRYIYLFLSTELSVQIFQKTFSKVEYTCVIRTTERGQMCIVLKFELGNICYLILKYDDYSSFFEDALN